MNPAPPGRTRPGAQRAWLAGLLFALLAMLAALPAHAVTDLQVTMGPPGCDAPDAKKRPTYRYTLHWASGSTLPRAFDVAVGNGCRMDPTACAAGDPGCARECRGRCVVECRGPCRVELRSCLFDNRQWMQVTSRDRTLSTARVTVAGGDPKRCR